ncbi:hypothetical protein [Sphaerisporangium perillae]|uniref:hypothetical protein n=1 Tax=Sphaerisporangium perillae TaxID=2935860 RepID=UPI0020102441|nr:hypothetical protein [Sphaerisporangium perillae]
MTVGGVVASAEYGPEVEQAVAAASELRHLVCDGEAAPGVTPWTWAELVAAGEREPRERREPAPTPEDAWALWLYTSVPGEVRPGTTGRPVPGYDIHKIQRFKVREAVAELAAPGPTEVASTVNEGVRG